MPAKDLNGIRFGTLTVISFSHNGNDSQFFHLCKCDCGDIDVYNQGRLLRGEAKRCKQCFYRSKKTLPPVKEGDRYGKWTVIGDDPKDYKCALVKCDCGKEKSVSKNSLSCKTSLQCKSCARRTGATTHGQASKSKRNYLYTLWCNIKSRTSNANVSSYEYCGKRGIKMCPPWEQSFEGFQKDIFAEIGPRPSTNHSLNRVNNEGNYEPGNINWALPEEQVLNRRVTFLHNEKPLNIKILSKKIKVRESTIKKLLDSGYSIAEVEEYSKLSQSQKTHIGKSINKGEPLAIEIVKQISPKKRSSYQRPSFYNTHHSIMQRCRNPKNKDYASYGEKGIDVFKPWHKLDTFSHDITKLIGEKPSGTHTLDRINPKKGYYPGNVQWATRKDQARNKQNTTRLPDKAISAKEMAIRYGMNKDSLIKLARQGFDENGIEFYSKLSFRDKKNLKILKLRLKQREAIEKYQAMKMELV